MKKLMLMMVLLALWVGQALAVEIVAEVNRTSMVLGEQLILSVAVIDGQGEVDISPIKDFKVTFRGNNMNTTIVNGEVSTTRRSFYKLDPVRTGELIIPALDVDLGGQVISTESITVTVTDQPVDTGNGRGDLFITAEASPEKVYVGQTVNYVVKAHVGTNDIRDGVMPPPDFGGFTVVDGGPRQYREHVDDRLYLVTEHLYLLSPISTGRHVVGPAELDVEVVVQGAPSGSIPFPGMMQVEPRTFYSKPVEIEVMPLPPYSGSVPFSRLVGDFTVQASIDSNTIETGDSATLSLEVRGHGNVMDCLAPQLNLPEGFKAYPEDPVDNVEATVDGLEGSRVFKYALVPLVPGEYDLGPMQIAFFEPQSGEYRNAATEPVYLVVTGDVMSTVTTVPPMESKPDPLVEVSPEPSDVVSDIDMPLLADQTRLLNDQAPMPLFWLFVLLTAPGVVYGLMRLVSYLTGKRRDRDNALDRQARNILRQASSLIKGDNDAFCAALHLALARGVIHQCDLDEHRAENMVSGEIVEILGRKGFASEAEEMQALFADLDEARYSGREPDQKARRELFERARKSVRRMCR